MHDCQNNIAICVSKRQYYMSEIRIDIAIKRQHRLLRNSGCGYFTILYSSAILLRFRIPRFGFYDVEITSRFLFMLTFKRQLSSVFSTRYIYCYNILLLAISRISLAEIIYI